MNTGMYDGWKPRRWETPVSDVQGLMMVSLVDDGTLTITLEDERNRRFQFRFSNYPVYRNILEEYRTKLWDLVKGMQGPLGQTWLVLDSPWIASLQEAEPLLEIHSPNLKHYVVCTGDDVIEVLSNEKPIVKEVEHGA